MKAKVNTRLLEMSHSPLLKKVRRLISTPFFLMLVASFALWYIAKLSYTYTTEIDVAIKVADQRITTTCVVEGVGTNLVGYKLGGGVVNVTLSDAKYKLAVSDEDGEEYLVLDQDMLNKAISVHYSDIKVISVEKVPHIEVSRKMRKELDLIEKR